MKHFRFAVAFALLALLILAAATPGLAAPARQTPAPQPGRTQAFEQGVYERLAAVNPQAVSEFVAATAAYDAEDWQTARQGFERVLALAPEFPDALRRLSYVQSALDNNVAALELARRAYTIDKSPYNALAVSSALIDSGNENAASEALSLARQAVERLPDDGFANQILMIAAVNAKDLPTLRSATAKVLKLLPNQPTAHYFAGLLAAEDGQWVKAEDELLLARKLGAPADAVQHALDGGIASQARFYRLLPYAEYAVAGWLATLVILFGAGLLLSAVTLRAVRHARPDGQYRPGIVERALRSVYGVVITLSAAYFYLSVPFLLLITVGGVAGTLWLIFQADRVPVRLVALVLIVGVGTIWGVIAGLFTRVREGEPGEKLPREKAPELWALAEEVARRVNTRPIDALYLTEDTTIAVTERGATLARMRGAGQRCLIVGLGALAGLSVGEFGAILAHEYGHFANRDTAGGRLALQVRATVYRMAEGLALRGVAAKYNPAWLFLNGFHRVFLRITLGATRLQEVLADRCAALVYGVGNFSNGLTHVIRQGLVWDAQVGVAVEQALVHGVALPNLYTLPPLPASPAAANVEKEFEALMNRPTSPYDSHPAPRERLRLIEALNAGAASAGGEEPAWSLLPDAEALQRAMTAKVEGRVRAGQAERALYIASQALALARQAGDRPGEGLMLREIAEKLAPIVGQRYEAKKCYHQAIAIFRELKDNANLALTLGLAGRLHEDLEERPDALRCYFEALALYEQVENWEAESEVRFNLAMIQKDRGEWEQAAENLRYVIAYDEKCGDPDLDEDRAELEEVEKLLAQRQAARQQLNG